MNNSTGAATGGGNAPRVYQYVKDIPRDWQLVSNSQDIEATLESIGSRHMLSDVGCMFVKVGEGEYTGVYYCERSLPLFDCLVYKLL